MNCKEVQREIQAFVKEESNQKVIKKLIEHLETCKECQEELSIQYLLEKGLERLEEGNSFDLGKELENKIGAARRRIRRRETIKWAILFFMGMAVLCSALFLLVEVFIA